MCADGRHLLNLELTADVIWCGPCPQSAGDVDLDDIAGCQLLKNQVQSHHHCALLGFIKKSILL